MNVQVLSAAQRVVDTRVARDLRATLRDPRIIMVYHLWKDAWSIGTMVGRSGGVWTEHAPVTDLNDPAAVAGAYLQTVQANSPSAFRELKSLVAEIRGNMRQEELDAQTDIDTHMEFVDYVRRRSVDPDNPEWLGV